ncbi:MAG: hypothetical protein HYZ53_06495 [Planctomycetes bacterium]|nr:hypothetical protein [Planctomycetota bacterium]
MNCTDLNERLLRLLDQELAPGEQRDAEAHLRECASCARNADAARRTSTLLAGLPRLRAPVGFAEAVAARIAAGSNAAGGSTQSPPPAPLTLVTPLPPASAGAHATVGPRGLRGVGGGLRTFANATGLAAAACLVVAFGLSPFIDSHGPSETPGAPASRVTAAGTGAATQRERSPFSPTDGRYKASQDEKSGAAPRAGGLLKEAEHRVPDLAAASGEKGREAEGEAHERRSTTWREPKTESKDKAGLDPSASASAPAGADLPSKPAPGAPGGLAPSAEPSSRRPPAPGPLPGKGPAGNATPPTESAQAGGPAPDPRPADASKPAAATAGEEEVSALRREVAEAPRAPASGDVPAQAAGGASPGGATADAAGRPETDGGMATGRGPVGGAGAPGAKPPPAEEPMAKAPPKPERAPQPQPSKGSTPPALAGAAASEGGSAAKASPSTKRREYVAQCPDVRDAVGTAEAVLRELEATFEIRTGDHGRRVLVARVSDADQEAVLRVLRHLQVARVSAVVSGVTPPAGAEAAPSADEPASDAEDDRGLGTGRKLKESKRAAKEDKEKALDSGEAFGAENESAKSRAPEARGGDSTNAGPGGASEGKKPGGDGRTAGGGKQAGAADGDDRLGETPEAARDGKPAAAPPVDGLVTGGAGGTGAGARAGSGSASAGAAQPSRGRADLRTERGGRDAAKKAHAKDEAAEPGTGEAGKGGEGSEQAGEAEGPDTAEGRRTRSATARRRTNVTLVITFEPQQ